MAQCEHMFDDGDAMSTFRSGLDEFRTTDLGLCSDEQIEAEVAEMRGAIGGLEVECARRIAEIERRRSFTRDGHLSITSWVESRFQTSWSEASKEVRLARALEEMPATREAMAEGEVSGAAVGVLVAAQEASPAEFSKA